MRLLCRPTNTKPTLVPRNDPHEKLPMCGKYFLLFRFCSGCNWFSGFYGLKSLQKVSKKFTFVARLKWVVKVWRRLWLPYLICLYIYRCLGTGEHRHSRATFYDTKLLRAFETRKKATGKISTLLGARWLKEAGRFTVYGRRASFV